MFLRRKEYEALRGEIERQAALLEQIVTYIDEAKKPKVSQIKEKDDKPPTSAQVMDEWLNGKEGDD